MCSKYFFFPPYTGVFINVVIMWWWWWWCNFNMNFSLSVYCNFSKIQFHRKFTLNIVSQNLADKCVYRIGIVDMSCICPVAVPFGYSNTFTLTYKLLWIHPPWFHYCGCS
jgi:hypothetical protein